MFLFCCDQSRDIMKTHKHIPHIEYNIQKQRVTNQHIDTPTHIQAYTNTYMNIKSLNECVSHDFSRCIEDSANKSGISWFHKVHRVRILFRIWCYCIAFVYVCLVLGPWISTNLNYSNMHFYTFLLASRILVVFVFILI